MLGSNPMARAKATHLQQLIRRWSARAKLGAGLAGAALVIGCSPTHAGPGTRQTPLASAPASAGVRTPATRFEQGCWVPDLTAITGRGDTFHMTADHSFVSIVPSASAEVRAAAAGLAGRLTQISGRAFAVREVAPSEAQHGIVLGTAPDFPMLAERFPPGAWQDEEAYLIRSEPSRLLLVAGTDDGISDVVWDFLHQLGYRRYFPGAAWQVIPYTRKLEVRTDRFCRPAFHRRDFFYGFGDWKDLSEDFSEWKRENRLGGLGVDASHSYKRIIKSYSEEFAAHPEYLGRKKDGKPSSKFCASEPGLVELVQRYAARQFDAHPQQRAISLEPSDGGGWEGCPGDAHLGSPSNRAVTLANAVASSINAGGGPPRFVGMYAYNEHAEPPTVAVDPNVVVFAANGFLHAGRSVFDILRGWQAKGQREGGTLLGVREYYSVNTWDRDLLGQARATSPRAVAESLSTYYSLGARFFIAEAGDGWGPHGLGYWTAAANLWTADQPADAESYVRDFLSHAFGRAATPMRAFYAYLDKKNLPLFGPELVGELYRLLGQGMDLESAPAVQLRLQHLAHYLRYLDLWLAYDIALLPAVRQQHFEELMRFTYGIRKEHMVHSWGLRRDLAKRDKRLEVPAGPWWSDPKRDPWRNGEPVTPTVVAAWIRDGQSRPRLPMAQALGRSSRLVRLQRSAISSGAIAGGTQTRTLRLRGKQRFELAFDAPTTLALGVTAGLVREKKRPVKLTLCAAGSVAADCQVKLAPADKLAQRVSFEVPRPGQYTLLLEDSRQGADLTWPAGTSLSIPATQSEPPAFVGRWTLYLYVPKGTRELVLYCSPGRGRLLDARGEVAHVFGAQRGIVRVPVPTGQDGTVWKFDHNRGRRLPLNVPPWFAASPDELLVPAEPQPLR
jgi:hypothetical protein